MKRFVGGFLAGAVFVPVAVVLAGACGVLPFRATAVPPRWESAAASRFLRASLGRAASGLANPLPETDATLLAGMKVYLDDCAGCHGGPRRSSRWGSNDFYPRVPQFREKPSRLGAPEMFLVARDGIRYSGMGGYGGLTSDEDLWRVVTFVSAMHRLPPAVRAEWEKEPKSGSE